MHLWSLSIYFNLPTSPDLVDVERTVYYVYPSRHTNSVGNLVVEEETDWTGNGIFRTNISRLIADDSPFTQIRYIG